MSYTISPTRKFGRDNENDDGTYGHAVPTNIGRGDDDDDDDDDETIRHLRPTSAKENKAGTECYRKTSDRRSAKLSTSSRVRGGRSS
jgi:hypothetical protein